MSGLEWGAYHDGFGGVIGRENQSGSGGSKNMVHS